MDEGEEVIRDGSATGAETRHVHADPIINPVAERKISVESNTKRGVNRATINSVRDHKKNMKNNKV